jgi:membrane AbrB-like protein
VGPGAAEGGDAALRAEAGRPASAGATAPGPAAAGPSRHSARRAATWLGLAAACGLCTWLVGLIGLPSPGLFAGVIVGLLGSLVVGVRVTPAPAVNVTAQAIVGVAIGAYVQRSTLTALADHAFPILLISVGTLALTIGAGLLLARVTELDRPTAAFGMIAGGASGIIAIARDLGADNRLVAVMQYLRVLIVLAITPPVAAGLFPGGGHGGATAAAAGDGGWGDAVLLCAVAAPSGLALARLLRLPAGSLLGPMLVTAGLAVGGVPFAGGVPDLLEGIGFIVIGLDVGLRFTPAALRSAGRILVPSLVVIAAMIVGCGVMGVLIAPMVGASALDGYLATTPGGLYASLGVAVDSGANTTFVLAVQVLRVFLMVLAAPLVARLISPRARRPGVAERPAGPPPAGGATELPAVAD